MEIFNWIIASMLAIVSYFLRDLHSQYKEHKKGSEAKNLHFSEELGKLKGKIEMVQQQAVNDITRIEQITQLKLDQISKDVAELTKIITQLVKQKL
jgi:hypothetical protein